jgi:hypothetical protein
MFSCHNTLAERKKHGYFEEAGRIGLEADQIAVRGRLPLQLHILTSNIAEYGLLDRESGEGTKGWKGAGFTFPGREARYYHIVLVTYNACSVNQQG